MDTQTTPSDANSRREPAAGSETSANSPETKTDLCLKNPKYQATSKMILFIAF